jgi:hypothetical protein
MLVITFLCGKFNWDIVNIEWVSETLHIQMFILLLFIEVKNCSDSFQ